MIVSRGHVLIAAGSALISTGLVLYPAAGSASEVPLARLLKQTHVHGLTVDRGDPSRLVIASHHGLHALDVETGLTVRISEHRDDLMGFVADPATPSVFLASGHPARGGNLGVIASTDGGVSWEKLSDGVNGPVDFHQMDISKADPAIVWGNHGGLQRSRDGGHSWERVAEAPGGLIDIAASAVAPERLYAATEAGLFVSEAEANSWQPAHPAGAPVSFVKVTAEGMIHAFILGEGLVRRHEESDAWEVLNPGLEERFRLYFTADPSDPERVIAATQLGEIIASEDSGRSWHQLGIE